MSRIIYVNGRYERYDRASVHTEDRGFQFADSVYEVMEVICGRLVDESKHMARLARSLSELDMAIPMDLQALGVVLRETVRRNRVLNGSVYVQVTRGVSRRDFVFPEEGVPATVVCMARSSSVEKNSAAADAGISVITTADIRWGRPDIKTTGLLPNVLARQAARKVGAREAWLVDSDGFVTEGAASNAWIVTADGVLKTRPAERGILKGVTRSVVLDVAKDLGLEVREEAFSVSEAQGAREAFVTAATALIMPVIRIDDVIIAGGEPGPVVKTLRAKFHAFAEIAVARP